MKLSLFSSITGVTVKDFETLDSGTARVYNKHANRNSLSNIAKRKRDNKTHKNFSIKLTFMISSPLKMSDVRGAVLEMSDLLCIQLMGDTLRGVDTDGIKHNLLVMAHVPEEFVL